MNSTIKTIHIGKKKKTISRKKIEKKNNLSNDINMLDDFIPRFTDKDIPKQDFFIDNSFELKKFKRRQNNCNIITQQKEVNMPPTIQRAVEPKIEPRVEPRVEPREEPRVEPKNESRMTLREPDNYRRQSVPATYTSSPTIVHDSHKQNLNSIIQCNRNKSHNVIIELLILNQVY